MPRKTPFAVREFSCRGSGHVPHVRNKHAQAVAAFLLGVVHRRVGVGEQHSEVLSILRIDADADAAGYVDRKSTRLNSSHGYISYAVFCLKKKKKKKNR